MNIHPTFTNTRSFTTYQFSALRMRAVRDSFLAKLTGRNSSLAAFPEYAQRERPNKKLIGLKDIRIDQIIGTLNRGCDFDDQFRPLRKHLSNRWVNILNLDPDGWEPILVHKVGEQYYVEDGHHRVSVARSIGMLFIHAKVWEYPVQQKRIVNCEQMPCAEKSFSRVTQHVTG
jgi:hypothetical protein